MNKALLLKYNNLDFEQKQAITNQFAQSNQIIRLLSFLEHCSKTDFRTTEVVAFLYPNDTKSYSILQNRYYKLRKVLLDALPNQSLVINETWFTAEEMQFKKFQASILEGNVQEVLPEMQKLEKHCWDNNMFELLPSIIDMLIYSNHVFNTIEKNKVLHKRYELSVELLQALMIMVNHGRMVYELNFNKGMDAANLELVKIRAIASKHKQYLRFKYCYEFLSAYYKLGSRNYVNELNIVGRHINQVKSIQSQHPLMPLLFFRSNYLHAQRIHFQEISAFYFYNICNFEEAWAAMQPIAKEISNTELRVKKHRNETTFINLYREAVAVGNYTEALRFCHLMIAFLKENNAKPNLGYAYFLLLDLYVEAEIKTKEYPITFLLQKLDEYQAYLETTEMELILADVMLLKAKLAFVNNNIQEAKKWFAHPLIKKHILENEKLELFYKALFYVGLSETQHQDLVRKINKEMFQKLTPQQYLSIRWIKKMLQKNGH